MAAEALIGGLALSAVGTMGQMSAANDAEKAQEGIIQNQQKAESARQQSMMLDADRRKREIVRQGIIAKSQALTVGTSQGAAQGSAMGGVTGQIQGEAAYNYQGVNNSVALGTDIFNANQGVLQGRIAEAQAGAKSAMYSGISSFGSKLGSLTGPIGNITGTTGTG